jgi:hypothetical protein
MSVLQKLTEGVVNRNLSAEGAALVQKWDATGLLEGLGGDRERNGMALMLENQAKELLREASAMSAGDVEGFAAVAFPLVRRVFGGLVGNELISVQPMSLPSGLIFFLDFTYTDTKRNAGAVAGESVYGGGRVGSQITGGVNLTARDSTNHLWGQEKSAYSLNSGYASPTGSVSTALDLVAVRLGSTEVWSAGTTGVAAYVAKQDELILHDPDLSGSTIGVYTVSKSAFTNLNVENLVAIHTTASISGSVTGPAGYSMVRRLTRVDPLDSTKLLVVFATSPQSSEPVASADALEGATETFTYPVEDNFNAGGAIGSVVGAAPWGLEYDGAASGLNEDIPEIDIKVDSIAVTAKTKKLKAKWTPELGQDLNAYHNLDAEVELTSILSEQVALEIDREILNDLVKGATGAVYYWSRRPGKFVDRETGLDLTNNGANLPDFTGNVSQWYETLLETINDASAQIHRKTLRGGANFIVTSPEVCSILEFTSGFRASVTVDDAKGTAGTVNVGTVSKKWDVYCDPYFPRNVILVGRKGSSFLESGFVYAPYVALQMTPTIFDPESFTPRKGLMTRYAKKMVRPDMYGLVVVADLLG